MGNQAIVLDGLGKQYRLGGAQAQYQTLRDRVARGLLYPVRRLAGRVNRTEVSSPATIWALKDVSLEIDHGQVIGIIGRNGAGKSTLLKILSRITKPTRGRARVFGRLGSLLEVGTGFHPELTGRENIYLNGAILGMNRVETEHKFDEIVAFSEMEQFLDTPAKHYSSGMYVRLAFAVAAHLEPEILLVDEVLAVGDAAFRKKCLGKVSEVNRSGRTVLLVSHNMNPIVEMCSKVIWLDEGKVLEFGDPREVVSHYLRDDRVPLGEVSFEVDPTVEASFVRVHVADAQGQVKPYVEYEDDFQIVFEYQVHEPVDRLHLGFKVFNERNVVAVQATTLDSDELADPARASGHRIARARIPGAWLAPGRYSVDMAVASPTKVYQLINDALAFEVLGGELQFLGNEVFRPRLEWTVS